MLASSILARHGLELAWAGPDLEERGAVCEPAELVGPIKIGRTSRSIEERLATLQIGCPSKLRLVAAIAGGAKEEAEIHAAFASSRIRGEWFKVTWDLRHFISAMNPFGRDAQRLVMFLLSGGGLSIDEILLSSYGFCMTEIVGAINELRQAGRLAWRADARDQFRVWLMARNWREGC